MKSCGTILIVGAVVLGVGIVASGSDASGTFISALVIMAVVGFLIQRSSRRRTKGPAPANAVGGRLNPAPGRGPQGLPGWSLVERSDALAREWSNNHPVLPTTGIWNVRSGRSHHRQVFVFQAARVPPSSTFLAFRMPNYEGPQFSATSDGRSEISVSGTMPPRLTEMLTRIGPRTFRRLGVSAGRLFWADLGPMRTDEVEAFVTRQLPGLVQTVNEHLTPQAAPAPAQRQPAPAQRRPGPRPQPTGQAPRPIVAPPPAMPSPKLAHDLGPDPDEILQTAPIELNDRPALRPAQADPVARSLENPQLSSAWKPVEWTPTPFELSAPMGLGETPSAADALTSGWKPREWSPPEYGASAAGEWKPAEAWQPNYNTTQD